MTYTKKQIKSIKRTTNNKSFYSGSFDQQWTVSVPAALCKTTTVCRRGDDEIEI